MDLRARFVEQDFDEILATVADSVRSQIYTALPVSVSEDSKDGHTVNLSSTVKAVQRNPDGTQELVSLPMFSDVPIHHMGGGGVTVTHPHKKGDEGLVIFASRSIDAWFQQGGEQKQVDARMHNLSDGFYIPGVRSTPRKLQNVSTNSTQMRSDDGKHFTDINPTSGTITHSVESGKHVTTVSKDSGIMHSADNGKHTVSLTDAGIALKTAMAVAMEAKKGMNLKGAMSVDGKISSSQPIGGSVLAGILQGGIGAVVGTLLTLGVLASSGGPSEGVQQARYLLTAAWVR